MSGTTNTALASDAMAFASGIADPGYPVAELQGQVTGFSSALSELENATTTTSGLNLGGPDSVIFPSSSPFSTFDPPGNVVDPTGNVFVDLLTSISLYGVDYVQILVNEQSVFSNSTLVSDLVGEQTDETEIINALANLIPAGTPPATPLPNPRPNPVEVETPQPGDPNFVGPIQPTQPIQQQIEDGANNLISKGLNSLAEKIPDIEVDQTINFLKQSPSANTAAAANAIAEGSEDVTNSLTLSTDFGKLATAIVQQDPQSITTAFQTVVTDTVTLIAGTWAAAEGAWIGAIAAEGAAPAITAIVTGVGAVTLQPEVVALAPIIGSFSAVAVAAGVNTAVGGAVGAAAGWIAGYTVKSAISEAGTFGQTPATGPTPNPTPDADSLTAPQTSAEETAQSTSPTTTPSAPSGTLSPYHDLWLGPSATSGEGPYYVNTAGALIQTGDGSPVDLSNPFGEVDFQLGTQTGEYAISPITIGVDIANVELHLMKFSTPGFTETNKLAADIAAIQANGGNLSDPSAIAIVSSTIGTILGGTGALGKSLAQIVSNEINSGTPPADVDAISNYVTTYVMTGVGDAGTATNFLSSGAPPATTSTITATTPGQVIPLTTGDNLVFASVPDTITQAGGSNTIVSSASSLTVNASAGNLVFFGSNQGDSITEGSGNTVFLSGMGVSTVSASSGADTVFAVGGMLYKGGTGSDLFVAGPTSAVTMTGAAQETIYGNTGGGNWNLSNTSQAYFGGGGGADSITFGSTAATVWGNTNENLDVLPSPGGTSSVHAIAFGDNDDMNLFSTSGNDSVILWNANIGTAANPVDFAGNTTLVASNAGNDLVAMFAGSQFDTPAEAAHTITVDNWQASDILDLSFAQDAAGNFLAGYTAADAASATAQLASGSSFTLSDGTTVTFQGAKPTTVMHI